MPRRKTLSDQELLDRLLPALLRLGLHRATLVELGAAVGLSPATLVQRFGSRQAVIDASLDRANDTLEEEVRAPLPAGEPMEALFAWLAARWAPFTDRASLAGSLEVLGRDFTEEGRRAQAARHQALLRERIIRSLSAAGVVPGDQARLARIVEAHWHGLVIQWGLDGEGELAHFVEQGLVTLWRTLRD